MFTIASYRRASSYRKMCSRTTRAGRLCRSISSLRYRSDSFDRVSVVTSIPRCAAYSTNAPHPPPISSTWSPGLSPSASTASSILRVIASSSGSSS